MKNSKFYPIRQNFVTWKKVGKEIVLLNLIDGNYYIINSIGFEIWGLMDGKEDIESIVFKVSKKYKTNKLKMSRDIANFVKELSKRSLIKTTYFPIANWKSLKWERSLLKNFNKQYLKPKITLIGTLKSDYVSVRYRYRLLKA